MRGSLRFVALFLVCGMVGATAQALNLYGDSAGSNFLHVIDPATGIQIRKCSPGSGNGRGMVVVGTVGYYTVSNSNNVFQLDINTCAALGVAFSVTGASGLSTIAYDGTNFWIGDYSGTNKAFHYSPTGTLLNTITLSMCSSFCDGLEFFNGKLISNRGDAVGPYDVYDTSGTLLTMKFIDTTTSPSFFAPTGIAFDGTDLYVSDIFNSKVQVYSGTTGTFIKTLTLTGDSFLIEDLSFDYQQVLPTPTPSGPTPTPVPQVVVPTLSFPMLGLLAAALIGAALVLMRR